MAARKKKRMSAQVVEDEDYQLRYERVAGIDVAKGSAVVCMRLPPADGEDAPDLGLREVIATVPEIEELAGGAEGRSAWRWCRWNRPADYWRIWFVVLEDAGLEVQLVNSSQARNLPGRPKTDKEDAPLDRAADGDGAAAAARSCRRRRSGRCAVHPASWCT